MNLTLPLPPLGNHYRGLRVIQVGKAHVPQWFLRPEAKDYVRNTAKYALASGIFPVLGPVSVTVRVYRKTKRGDIDGFLKVLLDSLQGIAYADDKQIVELHAYRGDCKENPRVEVEVREVAA